ncbi:MAG: hypothetical protein V1824_04735 [archaeon]
MSKQKIFLLSFSIVFSFAISLLYQFTNFKLFLQIPYFTKFPVIVHTIIIFVACFIIINFVFFVLDLIFRDKKPIVNKLIDSIKEDKINDKSPNQIIKEEPKTTILQDNNNELNSANNANLNATQNPEKKEDFVKLDTFSNSNKKQEK